jgi:hypothetical protein
MKTNNKKIIRLAILLASSLLIAGASASIYYTMTLNATVGVAGLSLKWEQGTNENVTCNIDGSSCTLTGLQGYPGLTATYNDTVRITNAGSSTVTFNITTTDCSGSEENLTSIYVKIYNHTDGSLVNTLTVWNNNTIGSSLTNLQIGAGVSWELSWEITWDTDALTSDSVNVAIRLDVKS